MKETYEISVKQRSRKMLRKFIKKRLSRVESAKVLCLPGHEAIEIFQVYDKLGIPRSNITCLERESRAANHLRNKNLGVKVEEASFSDFALNTTQVFDIVSLDFMGHQDEEVANDIHWFVAKRRRLSQDAILFTNFSANRERTGVQNSYAMLAALRRVSLEAQKKGYQIDTVLSGNEMSELEGLAETVFSDPLEYRSETIHMSTLLSCALAGVVTSSESFKYISDQRTPMFGDMFHIRGVTSPLFTSSPFGGAYSSVLNYTPPNRVFLGAESKRKAKVLSAAEQKHIAIRLIESGETDVHVIANRVGGNPRQISAWKAHVTMGTYARI